MSYRFQRFTLLKLVKGHWTPVFSDSDFGVVNRKLYQMRTRLNAKDLRILKHDDDPFTRWLTTAYNQ